MFVGSLGPCGIHPSDLLSLWDSLWDLSWDSSGIHETCVGPHVTRDTHVGLVADGGRHSAPPQATPHTTVTQYVG